MIFVLFLKVKKRSLNEFYLHPQGSQGPPGGVGSAGAVGEKVGGASFCTFFKSV